MAKILCVVVLAVAGCSGAVEQTSDAGTGGSAAVLVPDGDSSATMDAEATDAGPDASTTCFVAQDVYVEPGEDPTVGLVGVQSCSYTDLEAPPILGKPSGLVTYRCILACPESGVSS
jgi:hypothetical protein